MEKHEGTLSYPIFLAFQAKTTCQTGVIRLLLSSRYGGLAERSNAAVLKTVEGNTSGGSNPSSSANEKKHSIAGWSSPVARWAHNPKVVGSNPAPATKSNKKAHFLRLFCILNHYKSTI